MNWSGRSSDEAAMSQRRRVSQKNGTRECHQGWRWRGVARSDMHPGRSGVRNLSDPDHIVIVCLLPLGHLPPTIVAVKTNYY